ncbi:hypothetical protein ACM66B_002493 [Microbotryomycetes sp. NB124-2]
MAKATPGITIKLGSLHALPANKLYQHVLLFKETLEDASTFDAWHNALLLTARCYKGIFDGTIVETYGDVDPEILLADTAPLNTLSWVHSAPSSRVT